MKAHDKPKADAPAGGRRKYSTPVLRTYGGIRDLTRNVGTMGARSDGAGPMSKTS